MALDTVNDRISALNWGSCGSVGGLYIPLQASGSVTLNDAENEIGTFIGLYIVAVPLERLTFESFITERIDFESFITETVDFDSFSTFIISWTSILDDTMAQEIIESTKLVGQGQAFSVRAYPAKSGETVDLDGATLAFKYINPDGTSGTISGSETTDGDGRQCIDGIITEAINVNTVSAGDWYIQPLVTPSGASNPVPGWPKIKQPVLAF